MQGWHLTVYGEMQFSCRRILKGLQVTHWILQWGLHTVCAAPSKNWENSSLQASSATHHALLLKGDSALLICFLFGSLYLFLIRVFFYYVLVSYYLRNWDRCHSSCQTVSEHSSEGISSHLQAWFFLHLSDVLHFFCPKSNSKDILACCNP